MQNATSNDVTRSTLGMTKKTHWKVSFLKWRVISEAVRFLIAGVDFLTLQICCCFSMNAESCRTFRWHLISASLYRIAYWLASRFFVGAILRNILKILRKSIKRSLYIIEKLLFCVGKRLPNFTSRTISLAETDVPTNPRVLSAMPPGMKSELWPFFWV